MGKFEGAKRLAARALRNGNTEEDDKKRQKDIERAKNKLKAKDRAQHELNNGDDGLLRSPARDDRSQAPLPLIPGGKESWFDDRGGTARNNEASPVQITSPERGSDPPTRLQGTVDGDMSADWQGLGSKGKENFRPREYDRDSNVTVDKIWRQLRQTKVELPSEHFKKDKNIPNSLEGVETGVNNLIQAYGFIYQKNYEYSEALTTRTTECVSLQTKFDEERSRWNKIVRDLEAEVSRLKGENKKERDKLEFMRDENAIREQRRSTTEVDNKLRIQALEKEIIQSKRRHDLAISKLGQEYRQRIDASELATKEEMTRMKEACDQRIRKSDKEHEAERRSMAGRFEVDKQRMKREFSDENTRLFSSSKTQKDHYESLIFNLRKQTDDARHRMESDHEKAKAEMEDRFRQEKAGMEEFFQQEIATMDRQLRNETDQLQEKMFRMQSQHDLEMARKAAEIENMKTEHRAQTKRIYESHDKEKEAMEDKHKQANRSLRDDVAALTGALVKRDHFKPMSDQELARRFQNVAIEADEFARVRWDNKRESSWPFPDRAFRGSENERRTKQYVLQNTIWVILYEKIFCTPFRMFGNEGKSLDQAWIDKYGQDGKSSGALALSPKPSKDSERWRYETMKKCLEDINQAASDWESKVSLKQDYESSLNEIGEDMSHELERVASVSSSDKQRLGEFVRKVAQLWLEVGQQRYRIFLLMSSTTSGQPLRSGLASLNSDGTHDLIVTPELRRVGNAQGERLDRDELVSDCKGKFSVFHAR